MSNQENNTVAPVEEVEREEENLDQTDFMDNSNFELAQATALPADPQGQLSLVTKYLRVVGAITGVVILVVMILVIVTRPPARNEKIEITPVEQARVAASEEIQLVNDLADKMFIPAESALIEGLVDL